MILAPVALFVYNRPDHTRQVIEALKNNDLANETELFIFSDGAKSDLDRAKVDEVRKYLKIINGFKKVEIIERDHNFGLAESIIKGVTEIVNKYGRAVVLEDDLVTSQYFLTFMNQGLELYESNDQVISIHGYIYPVKDTLPETFFLKGADCWGWATWKRGWDLFENDGVKLLQQLQQRNLTKEFDFNNSYPYTKMLHDQIAGKNSSWAIRWYASAFLNNKLTLYPGRSLVDNIGFDGSGTHCGVEQELINDVSNSSVKLNKISIEESVSTKKIVESYFKSTQPSILSMVFNKLKDFWNN